MWSLKASPSMVMPTLSPYESKRPVMGQLWSPGVACLLLGAVKRGCTWALIPPSGLPPHLWSQLFTIGILKGFQRNQC